jgi:hypothetical protein
VRGIPDSAARTEAGSLLTPFDLSLAQMRASRTDWLITLLASRAACSSPINKMQT